MSADNASARQLWAGIKWLVGLFGGLLLLMLSLSLLFDPQEVTISQSPDGLHKIIVRQSWVAKYYIDRNFRIVLIDTRNQSEQEIFRSFDQDPNIKKERFAWSTDSKIVGLLGDDYFVVPNSALPSGEIVFLVYNLDTGKLWCNADNDTRYSHIAAQAAAKILGL